MAQKLNQIIAIEKGAKNRLYSAITELHKNAQKADLYYGFSKNYEPKEEGGEQFPPEQKKVMMRADDVLAETKQLFTEFLDITATKDFANVEAKADVTVAGQTLIKDAPVPYLLFLEKQLTDLRTFVEKMPTLDESDDWRRDEASGLFKTDPTRTHRTAKVQEPIVLYDATEKHPAQTQLITKDVIVGYWTQVKQSGAITRGDKRRLLERVEAVLAAVKSARETANSVEAPDKKVGADVLGYIFA
ncbi:MAG: hypothetical protein JSS81_03600 [Acidobacteria bacterium]|nr:hypothetical protein [Acidobacteriota bacterium]